MNKRIRQEYILLSAVASIIAVIGVLWYLIPRVENFDTISSREIDNLLYRHVDRYEGAFEATPELDAIFDMAIRAPEKLTAEDRQLFLGQERKFIGGWEAAWEHNTAGYLDSDRFKVWDEWYVSEIKRRPSFTWTENREHFSAAFARHVDESLKEK